jgi:hypothetical protein
VRSQTLAYLLPVLSRALRNAEAEFEALSREGRGHQAGALQAVVVAPSRELAMQIVRVGQSLLPHEARGCVQQAIGGANIHRQACFLCSPCQQLVNPRVSVVSPPAWSAPHSPGQCLCPCGGSTEGCHVFKESHRLWCTSGPDL